MAEDPSIELLDQKPGSVRLRVRNNTANPIYLYFDTINQSLNLWKYKIACHTISGELMPDNNASPHVLPELNVLDKGQSLEFTVDPIPQGAGRCTVAVLYYADESIAKILTDRPLDISDAEAIQVEQAKKITSLDFDLK